VLLEVDQAAGEDEDVALGDGLGDQLVGGGDEAHVEGAVEHEDDLGGAGVGVRRVQPAGGVVDAGHGHAQGVEARDLLHVGGRHQGAHGGVGGARLGQPLEEEWSLHHISKETADPSNEIKKGGRRRATGVEIRDADILEHVRIRSKSGSDEEGEEREEGRHGHGGCSLARSPLLMRVRRKEEDEERPGRCAQKPLMVRGPDLPTCRLNHPCPGKMDESHINMEMS
ncbi:hypothetical protein GW17_00056938, partial [Ensete ventricosum]